VVNRRAFLSTLTGGLLAAPLAVEAQQAGKVYRVGFVSAAFGLAEPNLGFGRGLRDSGLIEGENVLVYREFMGGRESQYEAVLADLERRVDVIVVAGPPAALAAKKVVTKVPVIFAAVGDPVAIGLVQSLAKPGGNFTGVAFDVSPDIEIKRLGVTQGGLPRSRSGRGAMEFA
jgi:putative ABC transport system substrate-binding protein